ncbi:hypothetical protein GCM10007049_27120 [Echinicola pacifica]|uniref:Uncharacterized protein n=1 Tax=Echinicola pacifica TaxID=346377 RepID=A0A918Q594_9BACT|nr:hypothetical protein [Echinicola pacifica]GGZ32266.1 hypothetical protein GCM10007049_27120 [Echinicola pacifica]
MENEQALSLLSKLRDNSINRREMETLVRLMTDHPEYFEGELREMFDQFLNDNSE